MKAALAAASILQCCSKYFLILPPPSLKVSNSALVLPSVSIKLQHIFTAYRGNCGRDDNKEVWGS